jgi:hypothetical protein
MYAFKSSESNFGRGLDISKREIGDLGDASPAIAMVSKRLDSNNADGHEKARPQCGRRDRVCIDLFGAS